MNKIAATILVCLLHASSVLSQRRIVGGTRAKLGEFPGVIRLSIQMFDNQNPYVCGGTLIDLSHVLTAAHCVHRVYPAKVVK